MIEFFNPYPAVLLVNLGSRRKGSKIFAVRQPSDKYYLCQTESGSGVFFDAAILNKHFKLAK